MKTSLGLICGLIFALTLTAGAGASQRCFSNGRHCLYRHGLSNVCLFGPPPGWGWYRSQRFRQDCRPPLAVIDERAGLILKLKR
jgi:hypothetical protein